MVAKFYSKQSGRNKNLSLAIKQTKVTALYFVAYTDSLTQEELIKQSCIPNLMYKVYDKWEAEECDEPRPTYAWHIDNLEIFLRTERIR